MVNTSRLTRWTVTQLLRSATRVAPSNRPFVARRWFLECRHFEASLVCEPPLISTPLLSFSAFECRTLIVWLNKESLSVLLRLLHSLKLYMYYCAGARSHSHTQIHAYTGFTSPSHVELASARVCNDRSFSDHCFHVSMPGCSFVRSGFCTLLECKQKAVGWIER